MSKKNLEKCLMEKPQSELTMRTLLPNPCGSLFVEATISRG